MKSDTVSYASTKPSQLRVLLLDDSEVMLELVSEMLRTLGVGEVLTAQDGIQGLAVFDAQAIKPDILLCDLRMPGMDGIEFLRNVAGVGYRGSIILLSGTDTGVLKAAERLVVAHGLNFLGVLEKPVDAAALAAALARNSRAKKESTYGAVELLTLEELRSGMAAGCIEAVFQPKVAVQGRRMLGVECLARWRHPQRGLLAPNAFIPVVEQHGLIDEFTLAVFRLAVEQQREWREQGQVIKININLSMDNLQRVELPEVLDGILREFDASAEDIVLEMTESRLMDNLKLCLDILIRLRLKGFGLSIDDFGTGYSTFENLKQLPFTELKVDRAFVNGAGHDEAVRAILESSIRLGRIFELNLVAEGVETQQDWDTVVASGCDEVQGYFVAKPMPAAELIEWKHHWEGNWERNEKMSEEMNQEMSNRASILVADDDGIMQEMLGATLGETYRLIAVASGEEALAAVADERPDLILLDVEMPPGINGYETCRRLQADAATADIPVIFVSGRDCLEDRLSGYEAGGEDYVTKPFDAPELKAKIAHLLKRDAERSDLKQMANYASTTAMTAMTSMSEMGALIETMKSFSVCTAYPELANAILAGLAQYGLRGVTQIRSAAGVLTRTQQGEASPLEASVINHMVGMDRIVQFKSRMSITYQRVTLLVHDMPTEDPDRCGRLRDHLAMLAEGAEARAEAIAAAIESQRRGVTIERAVARITDTLADIDQAQRQSQVAGRLAVEAVTQRMETAYISVALSTVQEDFMAGLLREGLDNLLNVQTNVFDVQNKLSSIVQELKGMTDYRSG